MNAKAAVLLLACALVACEEKLPPPSAAKPAEPPRILEANRDADNLLNLSFGAAVVSRTGEVNLDSSAAHAIDGMISTYWSSSPGWPSETLVYSLLAPSRISQIGVTPVKGNDIPRRVRFEGSLDTSRWFELGVVETQNDETRQLLSVKPAVAQYIRVSVLEQNTYYAHARGFHLIGEEVQRPDPASFSGCWMVNGKRAVLAEDRFATITGVIEGEPLIHLEGGTADNRMAEVMWRQGSTWGYAAFTRTPDGQSLTGLRFYNEPVTEQVGEAWMGERCTREESLPFREWAPEPRITAPHLSIFGLVFDDKGQLVEYRSEGALERIRTLAPRKLVIHDFTFDDHASNHARAVAKTNSLRAALEKRGMDLTTVQFVPSGSTMKGTQTSSGVQRRLATRVDIIPAP